MSIQIPTFLAMNEFHTPAQLIPLATKDGFRIKRGRYVKGLYEFWGMSGYTYLEVGKAIPVIELQEFRANKWRDWMVDDPPHWFAMQRYAEACEGEVLVAGLGLGLVLNALGRNPRVTKVTVIEKSMAVRDLVWPTVQTFEGAERIHLIEGDFWHTWRGIPYDSAVVDLWVTKTAAEKKELFFGEVLPLWANMQAEHLGQEKPVFFHGFQMLSSINLRDEVDIRRYLPEAEAIDSI